MSKRYGTPGEGGNAGWDDGRKEEEWEKKEREEMEKEEEIERKEERAKKRKEEAERRRNDPNRSKTVEAIAMGVSGVGGLVSGAAIVSGICYGMLKATCYTIDCQNPQTELWAIGLTAPTALAVGVGLGAGAYIGLMELMKPLYNNRLFGLIKSLEAERVIQEEKLHQPGIKEPDYERRRSAKAELKGIASTKRGLKGYIARRALKSYGKNNSK